MQYSAHLLYFLEAPQNVTLVKVNQYNHSELDNEYSWFLDQISSSNVLCHLGGKKSISSSTAELLENISLLKLMHVNCIMIIFADYCQLCQAMRDCLNKKRPTHN